MVTLGLAMPVKSRQGRWEKLSDRGMREEACSSIRSGGGARRGGRSADRIHFSSTPAE